LRGNIIDIFLFFGRFYKKGIVASKVPQLTLILKIGCCLRLRGNIIDICLFFGRFYKKEIVASKVPQLRFVLNIGCLFVKVKVREVRGNIVDISFDNIEKNT